MIPVIPIVADNGAMGGKKSEEFMLISNQGEDKILYDETTGIGLNTEILEREDYEQYLKSEYGIEDISNFKEIRTMELGHIFQLGTRYSEMMNGKFINQDGMKDLILHGMEKNTAHFGCGRAFSRNVPWFLELKSNAIVSFLLPYRLPCSKFNQKYRIGSIYNELYHLLFIEIVLYYTYYTT